MPTGSIRFPNTADHAIYRTTLLPPLHFWTIMAWGKLSVNRNATSTFWKFGANNFVAYMSQVGPSGTQYNSYNGATARFGTTLQVGEWYHLAQVCYGPGGGGVLNYLNGLLDFVTPGNGALVRQMLSLGDWDISGFEPINGCLAAVKIWDVPLSQSEIRREMRQYVPVRSQYLNTFSPLRSLEELSLNYANQQTPWTVVGTSHLEESGPPIPWIARRVSPVRYFDFGRLAGDITLGGAGAQMSWQAQTLMLARQLSVAPVRVVWRAQAMALGRVGIARPAQMSWQAQALALGRVLTADGAQMPWQGQTLTLARQLTAMPAQVIWQTQPLFLGRVGIARPTQSKWQAQALTLGRVITGDAARLQWQAQGRTLTRGLAGSPAQMSWQAQASALTQTIISRLAQMPWVAGAVGLGVSPVATGVFIAPLRYRNSRAHATALRSTGTQGFTRNTNLPPYDSFTVMFWHRLDAAPDAIATFWKFGGAGAGGYRLGYNTGGTPLALRSEGHASVLGRQLTLGRWYHIALVVSGTGTAQAQCYLDGDLEITQNGNAASPLEMCVGWWGIGAGENSHGTRCAFKVWGVPLSMPEIQAEMGQIAPVRKANLHIFSPWRTLNEVTTDYVDLLRWTTTGTFLEAIGPPQLPWVKAPRRWYVVRASGASAPTLSVAPAQMRWRAQATVFPQRIVGVPARVSWQARTGQFAQTLRALPAQSKWQAQAIGDSGRGGYPFRQYAWRRWRY